VCVCVCVCFKTRHGQLGHRRRVNICVCKLHVYVKEDVIVVLIN
jgi:hypothetical protein